MPLEHEHNAVALLNAERSKIVCTLRGCSLDILKGKAALNLILINMKHCKLFRIIVGNLINYIKAEVKGFSIGERNLFKASVFIFFGFNKLFANKLFG